MALLPMAPQGLIQQKNLVEQVADFLTQGVIEQRFMPGERLSEVQLSRDLGVSRAPVREAARLLESRGLLVSRPRRGFFVKALDAVELQDVFDLRLCLERHAIERLAQRYTPEARNALERQVDVLCEAATSDSGTRRIEEDLKFHRLMLHYAGNERLLRAFEGLAHELRLCITLITRTHEAPETIATSHYQLLEALASQNGPACREAIDYHIGVARDSVVRGINDAGAQEEGGTR
ncbi:MULTISPECIES: GntR family transcriptional regulator [unclassified Halomonas]|uniref:GntR family transcriptional regulator n=1 Tax=unclassified Halomonas TaxID=2609666 RepID=UPI0021E473A4|nr:MULTISPECIES: GntR family transcriptional regulator [unclassified Halomonas]UYF99202.1 GntR family transcriptional regulator [Halomonas sp. GD1P12]WNL39644.1 GntR family transcriptional regulator [Halomonas sp. PAMB 3232]